MCAPGRTYRHRRRKKATICRTESQAKEPQVTRWSFGNPHGFVADGFNVKSNDKWRWTCWIEFFSCMRHSPKFRDFPAPKVNACQRHEHEELSQAELPPAEFRFVACVGHDVILTSCGVFAAGRVRTLLSEASVFRPLRDSYASNRHMLHRKRDSKIESRDPICKLP